MSNDPSQLPTLSPGSSDPPLGVSQRPVSRRGAHWMRRHRSGLIVSIVALFLIAFIMLLWRGAAWLNGSDLHGLSPAQRQIAIDAIRGRLLQLGAGLLVAVGLVYTALNFRLSREGHVTDRFTKAIEQLGSQQLDVRLGAIYALERIMIDSERDHPTIVEVLAAFVREHSRIALSPTVTVGQAQSPTAAPNQLGAKTTTDVQAALTVLGRRPSKRDERRILDLRQTSLIGADLSYANLSMALLYRSDLTGAVITNACFTGVNFGEAVLTSAHVWRSDLAGANLNGAELTNAELGNVKLVNATFLGATLIDAFLAGSDFSSAIFTNANLKGAIMVGAN
jgi:hypothetical protein